MGLPLPLSSIRLPLLVATRTIRSGDAPIRTNPYTALVVGASDRRTHKELLVPLSRPVATLVSLVLMGLALVVLLPPPSAPPLALARCPRAIRNRGPNGRYLARRPCSPERLSRSTGLRVPAGAAKTSKQTPSGSPNLGRDPKEVCWR